MYYGSPYGLGFGDHDGLTEYVKLTQTGWGIRVAFKPSTYMVPGYYGIWLNGTWVRNVWCQSYQEYVEVIAAPEDYEDVSVYVMQWADLDGTSTLLAELDDDGQYVTLTWDWGSDVIGTPAISTLTNWALTGYAYADLDPDANDHTLAGLDVIVAVAAGTVTVSVYDQEDTLVAQGSAAAGSTITLAEQNSSGIAGSVDTAAGTADATGTCWIRWPKHATVERKTSGGSYSTIATVLFAGNETEGRYVDTTDLDADTYTYRVTPYSVSGAGTADTVTAVISGLPDAPTNLAYVLGTYDHYTLSFTEGAGATSYRVYYQHDDKVVDFGSPDDTITSSPFAIGPEPTHAKGTHRIWLRAVNASGEETNNSYLELEFDSTGAYVAPRPNDCALLAESLSWSGLQVNITGVYDSAGEDGTATELQMFVRAPGGSYDYDTPDDTTTLAADGSAALSYTAASAGLYYLTAKAATADGVLSENAAPEVAVYLDASALSISDLAASVGSG
jgi:hypothetical protein